MFPTDNLNRGERFITKILPGVKDLLGNAITLTTYSPFITGLNALSITSIDDYESGVDNWWQPSQSGQTTGIGAGTSRDENQEMVNHLTESNKSMSLTYEWNKNAQSWFIRLYLGGGEPRTVEFDTSYVLQVYVFGDGSGNLLRFCVDDRLPGRCVGRPPNERQW